MKWETEKSQSSFDARTFATNMSENRNSSRANDYFGQGYQKIHTNVPLLNQYSVVGIDVNKIENMRVAIRNYCMNITNHLNDIEPLANANDAFKSEEVQQAVRNYISKVKEYCINLTSTLLAFSDKLADVKNAWIKGTTSIADSVNGSQQAFDAGSTYTEQIS